jgi:hypothetical protein
MAITIERWLEVQTERRDSVGTLARSFSRRRRAAEPQSFEAWVISSVQLPVPTEVIELARLEFQACARMVAAGKRCETFPRAYLIEELDDFFENRYAEHCKHPDIDAWRYLEFKHYQLDEQLQGRKFIYLDTNHWLNIRHIVLQHSLAKPIYGDVFTALKKLVRDNKVICPISFPLFCELLQQQDEKTRYATGALMQLLSQGVCLAHPDDILRTECRTFLSKSLFPEDPADYSLNILTTVGFLMEERIPVNDHIPVDKMRAFQKALIDVQWEQPFSHIIELASRDPKLFVITHENYAWATSEDSKWYREREIPFKETWGREAWRILQSAEKTFEPVFKGTFEKHSARCQELMATEIMPKADPWNFPSIQILAGVNAFMITNGKRFIRNDMLDFEHASVGVPYTDIFCCDKTMANTLTHPLLSFDKAYGTEILSTPEALLKLLKSL